MQERKTSSMLQRLPVILAVTAASYGLQLPPSVAGRISSQGISGKVAASQPLLTSQKTAGQRSA
jgi:hypothetical protein